MARHLVNSSNGSRVAAVVAVGAITLLSTCALAVTDAAASGVVDRFGAVPQDFDCPMRQLAVEFAHKIQPRLTQAQLQQIADALDGAAEAQDCNTTVPSHIAAAAPAADARDGVRALPRVPLPDASAPQYYADAEHGSDSNSGTEAKPFATVGKAVGACQGSPKCTVVLREGTFYLAAPVELTPGDSGLTIQAYTGEEVWVSGGRTLPNLSWKPFNVKPPGPPNMTIYQNTNAVSGTTPTTHGVVWGKKTDSAADCEAYCESYRQGGAMCTAFTWHDANQGQYANDCALRTDGKFPSKPQTGHTSGLYNRGSGANIYVADLSSMGVSEITGLRVNGGRGIRARYPNADPELDGFGSTLTASKWSAPTTPTQPAQEVNPQQPFRNTSNSFQTYQAGVGGPCEGFTPQVGYWCGNKTAGGGGVTYRIPSGMTAGPSILPNSPYKNATGAVIQAWRPAHWASWMFQVGSYDASQGLFTFSKGGFQGARGNNNGAEFFVENVFEELDYPGEFYYDETAQSLYLYYNASAGTAPPSGLEVVATNLKVLITASGTQAAPVSDISISGIGFRDTALTYLDPHGMPSGGDWGLQRTAAVELEGVTGATIDQCTFERLDGNALMLSSFVRDTVISNSEFAWTGDSAIIAWGDTVGTGVPGYGVDGTASDQPRGTTLQGNYARELGLFEKQSSFYFQAKTCQTTLSNNIFFNGPRAGINFNDGFGGGNLIESNLLFNTCRESGDHGPFNSWDRQVYNWNGTVQKEWDEFRNNFVIANYNSQEAWDNDDGSRYFKTHDNANMYSGNGLKSDFGGGANHHYSNVDAFIGRGFGVCSQLPGQNDYFYNNTLIQTADGDYGKGACTGDAKTVVHDNRVFTPTGKVTECGKTLAQWQAAGNDPGTTAGVIPDSATILGWVKEKIGM